MDSTPPNVSFIGIVDFSQEARWLYMTESVSDLLGYEPHELVGRPSLELVHPDEFSRTKQLHYDTIKQDKAAVLCYLRMKHKDPYRGYILCGVSRTVVHNVLVGSVSFASPGAKALHNASTAQEITVITPSAANFEFRRWGDPSPLPPSPIPRSLAYPGSPTSSTSSWGSPSPRSSPVQTRQSTRSASFAGSDDERDGVAHYDDRRREKERVDETEHGNLEERERDSDRDRVERPRPPSRSDSPSSPHYPHNRHHTPPPPPPLAVPRERAITFDHLPNQSFRTAFILNRFSIQCNILYCSNDLLVQTTSCTGRSFFDFVAKKDEEIVRSWIDCVKGWGVNERGQPSDGGFGFGKFALLTEGRDSVERMAEPEKRARQGSTNGHGHHHGHGSGRARAARTASTASAANGRRNTRLSPSEIMNVPQIVVDAIFSAHSDGLMVILRRAEA